MHDGQGVDGEFADPDEYDEEEVYDDEDEAGYSEDGQR